AGDVKRGAVVNRSSYDRQPQCHVDCRPECQALDRDQSLIVITRRDRVELTPPRTHEESIRRERTCYVDVVFRATLFYCRRDFQSLFGPKQSVLAGMRIQPCDADSRPIDAEPAKLAIRQHYRPGDPLSSD